MSVRLIGGVYNQENMRKSNGDDKDIPRFDVWCTWRTATVVGLRAPGIVSSPRCTRLSSSPWLSAYLSTSTCTT